MNAVHDALAVCAIIDPSIVTTHEIPVDVEVFPTGAVIQPGHRLRIAVQAFDVPHLLSPLTSLLGQLVPVTVHTGPSYPSSITLPATAGMAREVTAAMIRNRPLARMKPIGAPSCGNVP